MDKSASLDLFRRLAAERLRAAQVPGAAIGLVEAGTPLIRDGIGHRDWERGLPVTPDTVFGLASVTKAFTTALILHLAEGGHLSVHDPVVRWLPEFRTPDASHTRAITLHHLLTHSSGMPPSNLLYRAMAKTLSAQDEARAHPIDTEAELLSAIADEDMRYVGVPGERASYSNEGFALLGFVVEHAADLPYADYLDDTILRPLGMARTWTRLPGPDDEPVTRPYRARPEGSPEPFTPWRDAPAMLAAGFLRSTLDDLLRFLEIFSRDGRAGDTRLLHPESLRAMIAPHVPYAPGQAFGYGVKVTAGYHGLTLVEHSGGLQGVASHFTVVPEHELTAAALANMLGAPLARLTLAAVNARLGLPLDEPRVRLAVPDPEPKAPSTLAGSYVSGERDRVTVQVHDGRLFIGVDGLKPARHLGAGQFLVDGPEPEFHQFVQDEAGRATAVTLGTRVLFREPAQERPMAGERDR